MIKLSVELVPRTCWYTNVRSNVSKSDWDIIRKKCYSLADNKCEICGKGKRVECHETWQYDDTIKEQKLVGLIALCSKCHKVKHFGLTQIRGEEEIAIKQLMKVNGMTREEVWAYIKEVTSIWDTRSFYNWKLDISFLEDYKK